MYRFFGVIILSVFGFSSCQPISSDCPLLAVPAGTDSISDGGIIEISAFTGECNLDSEEFIQKATLSFVAKNLNNEIIQFSELPNNLINEKLKFYIAVIDINKGIIKKSIFNIDIKDTQLKIKISKDLELLFQRKLYPDFPNFTIIAGFVK